MLDATEKFDVFVEAVAVGEIPISADSYSYDGVFSVDRLLNEWAQESGASSQTLSDAHCDILNIEQGSTYTFAAKEVQRQRAAQRA